MGWSKFSPEQMKQARNVDLYGFLMANYPDEVQCSGNSLRLKSNNSVSVKEGYVGFRDFGTDDKGGSIDFLMKYMGLSFNKAVSALLGFGVAASEVRTTTTNKPKEIVFPERDRYGQEMVFNYLCEQRKIPRDTVTRLFEEGLVYQERQAFLVFVNYEKTYYQVRRTYFYYGNENKIVSSGHTKSDEFWCFWSSRDAKIAYICEGAIDAISLYELNGRKPGLYVSMGGVSNQQIIDRIVATGKYKTILCVDNEDKGQKCRDRNPGLEALIPPDPYKDWNEILSAGAVIPPSFFMRSD